MSVWDARIQKALKYREKVDEHGKRVYERYEDVRVGADALLKKANFFYANTNTLKESLYNSLPKADVKKTHQGAYNDDVSRVACIIASRVLEYEVNCAPDFDEAVSLSILDRLVPGLGQVWCGLDVKKNEEGDVLDGSEHVLVEHVHWCDFIYEPAKKWSKVGWVGRRLHLSKKEFTEDFGEDALGKVGSVRPSEDDHSLQPQNPDEGKICVYEIWDKRSKKVFHIYLGLDEPLRVQDDPLELLHFFPCPRPLIANVTTNAFLPITDYHIAQDQYRELDTLYARIEKIVEAIKVAGLYDSSNTSIGRMFSEGENKLIPVDNWAMFAEQGGSRGMIDWYPVEQVVTVLQHLQNQFEACKSVLYEITGMSDIVRGASNQYETAAAQQIKAQFASVRMNGYQRDVAVYVRDIMRIIADIVFKFYSDQKLIEVVGQLQEPDMQFVPQAIQVLRDDIMTKYRVNVQANSLTQADWALEKEQRSEVVGMLGQMIQQMMGVEQAGPELMMLAVQMVKFTIAGFKGASELEGWLDQQLDSMMQQALQEKNNPQPPEPTPEEKKLQVEMQKDQMEFQLKQQESEQKMALEQQKMQLEVQKMQMEMEHQRQMNAMELQMKQAELALKQQGMQMDLEKKVVSAAIDSENSMTTHDQKLQQQDESHAQRLRQAEAAPKTQALKKPTKKDK